MLIALLTDFGTADHYVAAMKGVILSRAPGAVLVDVTHHVPPQDVEGGAFTLLAAYPAFPEETIFLAVVDPGVGSERRPVVVAAGRRRFVGPDNGLFSHLLEREPGARVLRLTRDDLFRHPVSATFHGRDVFAPVAAALALGTPPEEVGEEIADPVRLAPLAPETLLGGVLRGRVLHVDRYGNCVTSLTRDDLAGAGEFVLRVGAHDLHSLRPHYAGAPPGVPFLIWGSAGFLEVSVDRASAAERLRVRRGDPVFARPAGR